MQLFIRCPDGSKVAVDVDGSATVRDVEAALRELGLWAGGRRLLAAGRPLSDPAQPLADADCGTGADAVLELAEGPRQFTVDWAKVREFTTAADKVLNGSTLLVVLPPASRAGSPEEAVLAALGSADFHASFMGANDGDNSDWDQGQYTPPPDVNVHHPLPDATAAQRRLTRMLTCAEGEAEENDGGKRFLSPYRGELAQGEADRLAGVFLSALDPPPTWFAEVDPAPLDSLGFLDGFNDAAFAIACGPGCGGCVALLINNGSD